MTIALSPKQRRFVDEYLIDLNGTRAAIRAGYSARSAYSIAHENLTKPEVRAAIAKAQYNRELRTNITKDRILQELARICFFDIRMLYNRDGTLKRPIDLNDEAAAVIARIETVEMGASREVKTDGERRNFLPMQIKKIRILDKNSALLLAMRHLGILDGRPSEKSGSE